MLDNKAKAFKVIRGRLFISNMGLSALGLVFVLLWSSGWTASHYAVTDASALSVLGARYLIVLVVLLMLVTVFGQWRRVRLRILFCHLLIGALCHALYLLGSISAFELGVSASVVAFTNALQPVVTAKIAGSVTGEHMQKRHLKGLLLGLLSVALVVSESYQEGISSFALTLPFIAMLAITAGTVLNRNQEVQRQLSGQTPLPFLLILLIHIIGALLVLLPLSAMSGQLHWQFSVSEWTAIAWLALAVSLCSYGILLILLRHLSAVRVSSLTYLVPPATMLQSWILFDEPVSLTGLVSLCVAGAAVYLVVAPASSTVLIRQPRSNSSRLARYRLNNMLKHTTSPDIEL